MFVFLNLESNPLMSNIDDYLYIIKAVDNLIIKQCLDVQKKNTMTHSNVPNHVNSFYFEILPRHNLIIDKIKKKFLHFLKLKKKIHN